MYLGWARWGLLGATVAGLAFVGPSFVMVLALSAFYVRFGALSWMQGAFYGIGAAVIAIVARGAGKLLRSSVGRDPLLWAVVLVNALVVAAGRGRDPLGVRPERARGRALACLAGPGASARRRRGGHLPLVARHRPPRPGLGRDDGTDPRVFREAAIVVFGSGLAMVPFLHGGVVGDYGWLTERQFLDAVAVAMITPGPVVITVAFIGYLVAGPIGRAGRGDRDVPAVLSARSCSWRPHSTASWRAGTSRRP